MAGMKIEPCVRCGRQLKVGETISETGDTACAAVVFCRSLGIRPRVKSKASRGLFCSECMISVAHNALTPEGAFNAMIWEQLREINRETSAFYDVARMQIINPRARLKLMPGSKSDETLVTRVLKEAVMVEAS
jgi:hypothetical protein